MICQYLPGYDLQEVEYLHQDREDVSEEHSQTLHMLFLVLLDRQPE